MRNFLLAAIVMLFFAVCPAFAQCANGVCRAPQRQVFGNPFTAYGQCANDQCAAPQQSFAFTTQRTTVMATYTPVRNAVRNVRFMPFRRLFR